MRRVLAMLLTGYRTRRDDRLAEQRHQLEERLAERRIGRAERNARARRGHSRRIHEAYVGDRLINEQVTF